MTEVAFHFNAPDKQAYACRLLRKAYLQGARLLVLADRPTLDGLDQALWAFDREEFLPHSRDGDAPHVHRHSPIRLCSELPHRSDLNSATVLVNLQPAMPDGYEAFARVIEVVSTQPEDRDLARQRWMRYRAAGIEPQRHDLKLAGTE